MTGEERTRKAREALHQRRLAGEKTGWRTPAERAEDNPTLRNVVDAHCYICVGENEDPCWRWRVGNCRTTDCPAYPVRPHQHLAGKPVPERLRRQGWDENLT